MLVNGCASSNNGGIVVETPEITPTVESTEIPSVTEKPEKEEDKSEVIVSENISYNDSKGKRHYSFFGDKFRMTALQDLPSPLKISDAKYTKDDNGEYITIIIDFSPEGCKTDDCSNLLTAWNIYNEDYQDKIVQANKEYTQSTQNGYFVETLESIENVLEGEYKEDYSKIREDIYNGSLQLVWWE